MRIYFTADNQAEERLQKNFSKIIEILTASGVLIMSNLVDRSVSGFSSQDLEKINQSGEVLIERMDALVIEGSRTVPESGYLIAIALTHQKPILYLVEKGKLLNKNLLHLQKDKNTSRLLTLANYNEKSLGSVITEFLENVEKGEGREVPTIKFTLRITSRIERYLQWKTHNTKISKADFLRHKIEDLIDADEAYQKFIKK
ncbi:MAG: hypothetical protein PHW95_03780 [Patescibacteria group bacterium]|nr:hypothetical protein [Patescibacteria group bacterium]